MLPRRILSGMPEVLLYQQTSLLHSLSMCARDWNLLPAALWHRRRLPLLLRSVRKLDASMDTNLWMRCVWPRTFNQPIDDWDTGTFATMPTLFGSLVLAERAAPSHAAGA